MLAARARATAEAQRAMKRRRSAARAEEEAQVEEFFARFDTDHSGVLDKEQLRALLEFLNKGEPVSELGVEHVWRAATIHDDHFVSGGSSAGVTKKQLLPAVHKWTGWIREQRLIESVFARYDVDGSSILNHDQLKALLTDLAQGESGSAQQVTDADVDWVLSQADVSHSDGIEKRELRPALGAWTALMREKRTLHAQLESKVCCIS